MSPAVVAALNTPYRDAHAALDAFLAIRKAEGLSACTLDNYRHTITMFFREYPCFLQNPRAAILPFISEPEKEWSRFTRIKVLKVFCKFLVDEEVFDETPMRNIKCSIPGKRVDVPTTEDVKTFLDALDMKKYVERRLRVMLLLALDTGLRRGELCGLKVEDFDDHGLLLKVRPETSKVRKGRTVPVSPQVGKELRRFVALRLPEWRSPWMFPTETGGALKPSAFGHQIRRVSDRIGERMKIHGLRHLCATEFLRSTGNIALTAALLGHASISTTAKFYEHLDVHDLQEAHGQASVVSGVLEPTRKRRV
jgi:integrase/recombinase XerD